jgi:hypothetical protein
MNRKVCKVSAKGPQEKSSSRSLAGCPCNSSLKAALVSRNFVSSIKPLVNIAFTTLVG